MLRKPVHGRNQNMNKLFSLLCILSLSGCAAFKTAPEIIEKPVYVTVEVPVIKPCVSEDIPLPELYFGKLVPNDKEDPGKVAQYYVAGVNQLKELVLRQKKLLDACKIPATDVNTPVTPVPAPGNELPSAVPKPVESTPKPVAPAPKPVAPPTTTTPPAGGKVFAPPPPPR
jgi:hypothetical protein